MEQEDKIEVEPITISSPSGTRKIGQDKKNHRVVPGRRLKIIGNAGNAEECKTILLEAGCNLRPEIIKNIKWSNAEIVKVLIHGGDFHDPKENYCYCCKA
jgi:hypothetical protein